MELLTHGLLYGLILSAIMAVLIIASLRANPEIWLHDFPKDIQEKYGPISERSLRQRKLFTIPFMLLFFGVVAAAIITLPEVVNRTPTFLQIFAAVWIVFMTFNLVDLLILDWLLGIVIQPKWGILPGTEGSPGYRDYGFHLRGFVKGTIGGLIGSLIIAGIAVIGFSIFR